MSDVSNDRTQPVMSGPTTFTAPHASLLLDPILAETPYPPQLLAYAACAGLWICGQRKGVAHIPTAATSSSQHQFDCSGREGLRPAVTSCAIFTRIRTAIHNMQLKEQALAMTPTSDARTRRYRPDDRVLDFLRSL
jgi:hypothetical protein